jgi:two-component system phosphate regulon sensor histidine kinase PhoR
MKNSIILRVLILGAIAVIGITALQTYWVVNTWNINEEEFSKKVNLALYNVARSLAEVNQSKLPPRNIINQRTTNYYIVNIEDEIDANLLEYFLQKEFESLALNVDFEYAVFDCTTDEMVYGNYISFSPNGPKDRLELGQLPRYEQFTYYFGVKFPTRSGYLFDKMQLSIAFSMILLLTLIFFAYSMYVIFRQKRLSEMQKDFINNMTHEFKTPLSTIRISADVFLRSPLVQADRRLSQYAKIIKEQNQRLNRQVEKVLNLAKIERGNFKIKREPVNLSKLLQNIADSVSLRLEKNGGALHTDLSAADRTISADPLHLTNIIHNLLDNAVKYCREVPHIQLITERRHHFLHVRIRDDGIGINKEYQNRIFEKFFRVPTGNVHNVKGFGLGLYYVRKICEAHGWRIRLDSVPNEGTTFAIIIPIEETA